MNTATVAPSIVETANAARARGALAFVTTEYVITDGVDVVLYGAPGAPGAFRHFATPELAAEAMDGLCWHPRHFNGPFRVEAADVFRSAFGGFTSRVVLARGANAPADQDTLDLRA
jgi:hypothetical protein